MDPKTHPGYWPFEAGIKRVYTNGNTPVLNIKELLPGTYGLREPATDYILAAPNSPPQKQVVATVFRTPSSLFASLHRGDDSPRNFYQAQSLLQIGKEAAREHKRANGLVARVLSLMR